MSRRGVSPIAAELVQEQGREYTFFVAECIESIHGTEGHSVWKLVADSYHSVTMTSLQGPAGQVRLDLFFSRRASVQQPGLDLYVEAKGSYDQDYVNRGFREFLEKLARLGGEGILGEKGRRRFLFVAPLLPRGAENPRGLADRVQLRQLLADYDVHTGGDEDGFCEALAPRLLVLQLPTEHRTLFDGGA